MRTKSKAPVIFQDAEVNETLNEENAPAPEGGKEKKDDGRRAVILVHGMGETKKHSMLFKVTDAIAEWMPQHLNDGLESDEADQPELEEKLTPEDQHHDPAAAPSRIDLGYKGQHWRFVEVWWARSFQAPSFDPLIGWTIRRFLGHLLSLAWGLLFQSLMPFIMLPVTAAAAIVVLLVLFPVLFFLMIIWTIFVVILIFVRLQTVLFRRDISIASLAGLTTLLLTASIGVLASRYGSFNAFETLIVVTTAYGGLAILINPLIGRYQRSIELGRARRRAIEQFADAVELIDTANGVEPESSGSKVDIAVKFRQYANEMGGAFEHTTSDIRWLPDENSALHPSFYIERAFKILGFAARPMINPLRLQDERIILDNLADSNRKNRFGFLVLISALVIFHAANALVTITLYVGGMVLLIPVMFLVWILSLVRGIRQVATVVNFIKSRVDSFLVGSLGDIKVFMDEPVQARMIRREFERAIMSVRSDLEFRDAKTYVIAHSTGAAIAYECLVLDENKQLRKKVKALITVGSIMRLVRSMGTRRTSFNRSLPDGIDWLNIWTRYDPALAGPMEIRAVSNGGAGNNQQAAGFWRWPKAVVVNPAVKFYGSFAGAFQAPRTDFPKTDVTEHPVSNEGDPFNDHSGYWRNEHQVIPKVIEKIWGETVEEIFDMKNKEVTRVKRRKYRILMLAPLRLPMWYLFPFSMVGFLTGGGWVPGWLRLWEAPAWIWDKNAPIPLMDFVHEFLTAPYAWWERGLIALVYAVIVTFVGQLAYRFLRAVVWDGFLEDRALLRA